MRIIPKDIDGDGMIGGIENINSHDDKGILQLKDTSELGEALDHLNRDIENERRMSSVDFISRIDNMQLPSLVAVDTIASMGVISRNSRGVVNNYMRKSVSLQGQGREDIVNISVGKKEQDIRKATIQNLSPSGQQR